MTYCFILHGKNDKGSKRIFC